MKKTFENLKLGDTCYCLDVDNQIIKEKIHNIEGTLITYSTGCKGRYYHGCPGTGYGMYSAYIYFNLEDALEELKGRIKKIEREIEKWKISGQD